MSAVTWTRTDDEGRSVSVVATPTRMIAGEAVFEITEAALELLLTEAGFVRDEVTA
jgi:hypothetical protein